MTVNENRIAQLSECVRPARLESLPRRRRLHVIREHRIANEALWTVQRLRPHARQRALVITDNPCPEYALDLLELEVSAVFIGEPNPDQWLEASLYARSGVRSGLDHLHVSTLLPSERGLLKYIPLGWGYAQIAEKVGLSPRTVRNRVCVVLEKLHLHNRTQLAMYYTGQWQFLEPYRHAVRTQVHP
jgi:DNA-binding NarL/FixJ family response regulator